MRDRFNPSGVRGVYAFECSLDETTALDATVRREGSLASVLAHVKFYEAPSKRAIAIGEQVDDAVFADAVNTHAVAETTILVIWVYRGADAAARTRECDDFGVAWGALTLA